MSRDVLGVQTFGASGPPRKKSCLGPHIKYIAAHTHTHTQKNLNVLSKFMILCWATFIAILGHIHSHLGLRVGHPGKEPLSDSIREYLLSSFFHNNG